MTTEKNSGPLPIKSLYSACALCQLLTQIEPCLFFFKQCMLQDCFYLYPFMRYTHACTYSLQ
jgi:hypothetical protein